MKSSIRKHTADNQLILVTVIAQKYSPILFRDEQEKQADGYHMFTLSVFDPL